MRKRQPAWLALCALALASMSCQVLAATKTYTPGQLRSMVSAGHPPAQLKPTTKTLRLGFADCVNRTTEIIKATGSNYPHKALMATPKMTMIKLWTNDAAMTLTCSASDRKMVVTQAAYR